MKQVILEIDGKAMNEASARYILGDYFVDNIKKLDNSVILNDKTATIVDIDRANKVITLRPRV